MNDLRYEQISIDEIDLSVRSYNALKRAGIETLAELVPMNMERFLTFEILA